MSISVKPCLNTEEEAFNALKGGNERGLETFFRCLYSPLALYSTSITGNAELSKEIASEAFAKLWNNRKVITEWQRVKPLLYRMVYNASIDYLREQRTLAKRFHSFVLLNEETERTVFDKLVEAETYHRLHTLLEKLPPRSRQIFRMFYFQKKAIKEIATELGVSVNTVKTQKLRALQFLKEHQSALCFFIVYCLFFI